MIPHMPIFVSLPAPGDPWTDDLCASLVGHRVPLDFMGHRITVEIAECEPNADRRYAHMTLMEVAGADA